MEKIIVKDAFQEMSRGQVIICNYDDRLHVGTKVKVHEQEYEIKGVEGWMKLLDPPIHGDWVGLVLSPNIHSMYIEIGDEIEIV